MESDEVMQRENTGMGSDKYELGNPYKSCTAYLWDRLEYCKCPQELLAREGRKREKRSKKERGAKEQQEGTEYQFSALKEED